jgi:molybdopterin-guanine dinucleotide biosynthesis protein A
MRAGILILAGGNATRLPGKLALDVGGLPMVARVYRNLATDRETWISHNGALSPGIDALVPAPAAIDRWPGRGPLGGLLTTMAQMRSRWVFAIAGDAPLVDASFVDALCSLRTEGDEAIVPSHDVDGRTRFEPLAALYDRLAFVRAGMPVLRSGRGALHAVLERLRVRAYHQADARIFANVNTPADHAALRAAIEGAR